jgi:release factor glutamine methyltransferase
LAEILNLLQHSEEELVNCGIESARLNCEQLFSHLLQLARHELYSRARAISPEKQRQFARLLKERKRHMPLQYILGKVEFMGLEFCVNQDALIPRPETEVLLEAVLKILPQLNLNVQEPLTILDLGTGSSNIAVSLAHYIQLTKSITNYKIIASDLSLSALALAKKNIAHHHLADKVRLTASNWFGAFKPEAFDLIVANPPYLAEEDWGKFAEELKFEPELALNGGPQGLFCLKQIILAAALYLKEKAFIFLEIGETQTEAVKDLFARSKKFSQIEIIKDLNQKDRVIFARKI